MRKKREKDLYNYVCECKCECDCHCHAMSFGFAILPMSRRTVECFDKNCHEYAIVMVGFFMRFIFDGWMND